MARLSRLAVPGHPHHLIQRGNNRQPIFLDDEDRHAYHGMLREAAVQHSVAVHAYVLMENHVHLLATPQSAQALSLMMQALGRRYVAWFNRRHQRSGTLWEGRFRGCVLESERFFLSCMRYIELNPVRHGLVAHPAEFPWSSHRHHIGIHTDPLIVDHELFWTLGNTPFDRQSAYKALIEQSLSKDEVEQLSSSALKGWGLGSPAFLEKIGQQTGRRMTPRPRGRPRKDGLPVAKQKHVPNLDTPRLFNNKSEADPI
jgi:putative transposase